MKRAEKGVFSCASGPVVICAALRGGGRTHNRLNDAQLRRDVFGSFFCVYPLPIGLAGNATAKSGRTIATPQKRGFPTGPDSGPVVTWPCRARRWSLSSSIIPAGRLRSAPLWGAPGPEAQPMKWRRFVPHILLLIGGGLGLPDGALSSGLSRRSTPIRSLTWFTTTPRISMLRFGPGTTFPLSWW